MLALLLPIVILAQNPDEVVRPRNLPRNLPLGSPRGLPRPGDRAPPVVNPDPADAAAGTDSGDGAPPPVAQPLPPPTAPVSVPTPPSTRPQATKKETEVDVAERLKNGKFNFEFSKADIMDVVKAISNLTQRNFIIPEKVKSQKITILSPGQITAAEAYSVFLAALEANGITVVRSGKFYKLVESKEAIKSPIPTCIGDDDNCPQNVDQMITVMIRLNYVDGSQLNNVLKSLIGKDGDIQLFQPSNAVIISDYARNLTRVRRIIDSLDVPGFQDELQIVDIEYATATEVADKITQIFEVQAKGAPATGGRPAGAPRQPNPDGSQPQAAGADNDGDVQISKIVPDDRTNQIIIKANKRSFDAIRRLIAKLDIPVSDIEQGRVHVYYLYNASAEELSSTLSALAQGQPNAGAGNQPGQGGRRNPPGAPPQQQGGNQQRQGSETASLFEGDIKITADKATNSLLVMASGRDFRSLRRIIEQLDIPRRQVYVEAAIMEVSVDNTGNYGTQWHVPTRFGADDLPGGVGGPGSLGFFQNPGTGQISPTLTDLSNPASLLSIANGSIVGLVGKAVTIPVGDNSVTLPSFGIVLKALQTQSNVQILSTPHILTMDNEEASIEVGRKIPFRRGTSLPALGVAGLGGTGGTTGAAGALGALGGASSLFSSVDRIDVTLKLTVTPQINESDRIRLEIDQDIEDVAGTDPSTSTPITSKRQAKTTVVVDDQQTIVIGGLMRDNTTQGENKIPILGDIPVLGWLFKTKNTSTQKINLILVLTPYIVRSADDFQAILERKVREYEEFAAEYYGATPKYRAYIDYRKKTGPLARLAKSIAKAKERAESGQTQDGDTLVKPKKGPPGTVSPGEDPNIPRGENLLEPEDRRKTVPMPVQDDSGTDESPAIEE